MLYRLLQLVRAGVATGPQLHHQISDYIVRPFVVPLPAVVGFVAVAEILPLRSVELPCLQSQGRSHPVGFAAEHDGGG